MRRCTYCGKEYPDEIVQCSIDGNTLEGEATHEPPAIGQPPTFSSLVLTETPRVYDSPLNEKSLRVVELALICIVAFSSGIFSSVSHLLGQPLTAFNGWIKWPYGFLHECAGLALLWYVLFRRSKSLFDIGFSWKWSDLPWAIVLRFCGYLAFFSVYHIFYDLILTPADGHAARARVGGYLFGGGAFTLALIYQCINPFSEELIVRAYVMTEVRHLTNSMTKAVIVSTLLQMSYHFYQGAPMAIAEGAEFLVWSVYYARTNRITPIILAHASADIIATFSYVFSHPALLRAG